MENFVDNSEKIGRGDANDISVLSVIREVKGGRIPLCLFPLLFAKVVHLFGELEDAGFGVVVDEVLEVLAVNNFFGIRAFDDPG